jgi:hypothetical protein
MILTTDARSQAEQIAHTAPPSDLFACLIPSHVSQELLDQAKTISQSEDFKSSFEKEQSALLNDHGAFGLPWILLQRPGEDHIECFWGRFIFIKTCIRDTY